MIDCEDVLSIQNSKQSLILWTRQLLYVRETVFKNYKQQNIFENTLRDKTHPLSRSAKLAIYYNKNLTLIVDKAKVLYTYP